MPEKYAGISPKRGISFRATSQNPNQRIPSWGMLYYALEHELIPESAPPTIQLPVTGYLYGFGLTNDTLTKLSRGLTTTKLTLLGRPDFYDENYRTGNYISVLASEKPPTGSFLLRGVAAIEFDQSQVFKKYVDIIDNVRSAGILSVTSRAFVISLDYTTAFGE